MKPAIALLVLISALTLMWACAAVRLTESESVATASSLSGDQYEPIQKGMTVSEVMDIVGSKPTEKMENLQSKFLKLEWQDANKSAIRVRFKNGRVISADCTADISDRILH